MNEAEQIKEQLLALSQKFRRRLGAFSDSQKSEVAAELRQIEAVLRESEGRFQLVAQASHEAVWDWNLITGEVWRNQGFEILFGYSEEEIDNSPGWWQERIHPEDRERVMNALPAFKTGNVHPVAFDYRFRRSDGSYAYVLDRSFFLTNANGQPIRMIGAMLDASERQLAEAERCEYTRRLQSLTRQLFLSQENERRRLARTLHDEIAQLLTGLLLQLDLCTQALECMELPGDRHAGLTDAEIEDRRKQDLSTAIGRITDALKQAHDLMARVRALSLDLRPVILDDMGLLHSLKWHIENFMQRTKIQVEFQNSEIGERFPAEVESAVFRLVQEALANVARHAGVTQATLNVSSDRRQLWVEVLDQGIGFDPATIDETKEPTGISEMRQRVLLLGGQFTLESSSGKGTRLIASIPLQLSEIPP